MDSDGGDLAADLVPGGSRLPARRDAVDEQRDRPGGLSHRCVIIAGVKGSAVLSALLILLPWGARAADDVAGAVRELARKTVALAGRGEPVSISWRNLSSLSSGDFNQVRTAFDGAVRDAGGRVSEIAPLVEVRLTLSGNPSQFLMVAEARKGEDRQVWIASWKRTAPAPPAGSALTVEKKLVWEQEEPILDMALLDPGMLVLSPSRVSLQRDTGTQSLPLTPTRPWPRDLRGHLRVNGGGFKVYLPGVACSGATDPSLTMECHPSDEPWTLDAGTRGVFLAGFTPGRNYFDGRVSTANALGCDTFLADEPNIVLLSSQEPHHRCQARCGGSQECCCSL